MNLLKASVIHPATEKHVAKYESRPLHMICETPALYHSLTLPYLRGETFNIDWVFNILSHKKEAETIVYENSDPDDGFILLPDYKWNEKQVEDLYLICIIHKRDVKSIRDLRAEHLPMLKDIWASCTKAIKG